MRTLAIIVLSIGVFYSHAQSYQRDSLFVSTQSELEIEFPFANNIEFEVWNKDYVLVEVWYTINDGEDDDIYKLDSRKTDRKLTFVMDEDAWKKDTRSRQKKCWETDIEYIVHLPKSLALTAESISGNYLLTYYGQTMDLKTISGDIDISLTAGRGFDFEAKSISGEIYSDLDITFPEGKDGLRQIVGVDVHGIIGNGGERIQLETISGNVFLRKGLD